MRLENTSRVDTSATEVARLEMLGVSHALDQGPLNFALSATNLIPGVDYQIRVHVDMDGKEPIAVGDQITMESFPVWPTQSRNRVTVRVRKVE